MLTSESLHDRPHPLRILFQSILYIPTLVILGAIIDHIVSSSANHTAIQICSILAIIWVILNPCLIASSSIIIVDRNEIRIANSYDAWIVRCLPLRFRMNLPWSVEKFNAGGFRGAKIQKCWIAGFPSIIPGYRIALKFTDKNIKLWNVENMCCVGKMQEVVRRLNQITRVDIDFANDRDEEDEVGCWGRKEYDRPLDDSNQLSSAEKPLLDPSRNNKAPSAPMALLDEEDFEEDEKGEFYYINENKPEGNQLRASAPPLDRNSLDENENL